MYSYVPPPRKKTPKTKQFNPPALLAIRVRWQWYGGGGKSNFAKSKIAQLCSIDPKPLQRATEEMSHCTNSLFIYIFLLVLLKLPSSKDKKYPPYNDCFHESYT